jgi:hypothetical protein
VRVYNSTTLRNDPNWRFNQAVSSQVLQNNISYDGDSSDIFHSAVSDSFNSWNGAVTLDDDDFASLERFVNSVDLLKAPRKADGSLPDLGEFLKLAEGSDLIDAGTPVSFTFNGITYNLPFSGTAPDMGAFEFVPSTGLMGDYNNNDIVDAADYTVWRDTMAGGGSLVNDPTPESVSESDFTYWREHFGATSGAGAGSASVVPEPGTFGMMLVAAMLLVGRWRRCGH